MIASVPVFVRPPCSVRAPPCAGSTVITPALAMELVIVTLLPLVSALVSVIAPLALLVIPAEVVSCACALFVLATISVCLPVAAPTVSALTETGAVWFISTV